MERTTQHPVLSAAPRHPTSCAMLVGVIEGAREAGLPIENLTDGMSVSLETIEAPRAFVDWDDACEVFSKLGRLAQGSDGLRQLGQALGKQGVLGPLGRLLRVAVTPTQLYKLLARWYVPANIPATTTAFRVDEDGQIHLRTVIDPQSRDCPQLFHIARGALEVLPELLGLGRSIVRVSITERCGTFVIMPPSSATAVAQLSRVFHVLRGTKSTIDELTRQQTIVRQSLDQLAASEARFRRLAENTHDMLAEWDSLARCAYVSPNVARLLGVTQERFREDPWSLIHPDDRQPAGEALRQRFQSGIGTPIMVRMRCANGSFRWFENTANVATAPTGDRYIVTVSRDVTERRDLEAQLHQSQKIEALGRLAGGVAHDFNNLLTIIGGASEALLETVAPEGEQQEDVQMILEAADRAAALTRQLLTFGRRERYERRPLDIGRVALEMESMLSRLLRENIELMIDVEKDLPLVLADVGQIEQVLLNLTVNAIDAMPKGGKLRIAIRTVELDGRRPLVLVGKKSTGPHVEIGIEDTGVGIDEEALTRIFDPFFTTKETGRGTGLGLSTVHGIVEQLGGHLSVESALTRGTRVSALLPIFSGRGEELETSSATRELAGKWHGTETILLVEHETAGRNLIRRQLVALGYEVLSAESAAEATQLFESADSVDLLLTDLAMPERDGLSLARALRAEQPGLKILFISGFAQASIENPLIDSERNLLAKPFRSEVLAQKLRSVLDGTA